MQEMKSMKIMTQIFDTTIAQLESIRANAEGYILEPDYDEIWEEDIDACNAAIAALKMLRDEGITDAEGLKDLIFDRDTAIRAYQRERALRMESKPMKHSGTAYLCPVCAGKVHAMDKVCRYCGQRLRPTSGR